MFFLWLVCLLGVVFVLEDHPMIWIHGDCSHGDGFHPIRTTIGGGFEDSCSPRTLGLK